MMFISMLTANVFIVNTISKNGSSEKLHSNTGKARETMHPETKLELSDTYSSARCYQTKKWLYVSLPPSLNFEVCSSCFRVSTAGT